MSEISTLNPHGFESLSHDEMLEIDGGFLCTILFTAASVTVAAAIKNCCFRQTYYYNMNK